MEHAPAPLILTSITETFFIMKLLAVHSRGHTKPFSDMVVLRRELNIRVFFRQSIPFRHISIVLHDIVYRYIGTYTIYNIYIITWNILHLSEATICAVVANISTNIGSSYIFNIKRKMLTFLFAFHGADICTNICYIFTSLL